MYIPKPCENLTIGYSRIGDPGIVQSEDFISDHIGLIDSVFRALLVNGNQPLNALELGEITGRNAATILKTIGGVRVYRGIRPHHPAAETKA